MPAQQSKRDLLIPDSEKREAIRLMALADDTFFNAVCKLFPKVAEFILRLIMEIPDLVVKKVETQSDERSMINRSIELDILAEDSSGKLYDIELENSDSRAIPERARYHSAVLDSNRLEKAKRFEELPETYIIFITKGDPLGTGLQLCHVERVIMEQKKLFNDREHIIYASMKYADETPLGQMLHDFLCTNPQEMLCEELAKAADYLKNDDKGVSEMCEVMEKLINVDRRNAILELLNAGVSREVIMKSYKITKEELEELIAPLASD